MSVEDIGYGDQFHGWYDRIFPKDGSAEAMADFLVRNHPDPSSGTLEFGVGTGRIAIPLSQRIGQVVGVDSSTAMLEDLQADPQSEHIDSVLGDMRNFDDDRTFGLVYIVCSALSQLLDKADQQAAINQAASLLAPGGRLIVETHNRPGCVLLHEGKMRTTLFIPYPEKNTGLQTHATLLPDDLWHCSQIWFEADGTHRIGQEMLRLLVPDEVDEYARNAGLVPQERWADAFGNPYVDEGPMFITTYQREA